ncbi:MAG: lysozyme inhibitor LprI family protein [Acidithiobacillus sp.]
MKYRTYLPIDLDIKPNMRRGTEFHILLFLLLFPLTAWASITAQIKEGADRDTAMLLLKDNGKVVKRMDIDLDARHIPDVTAFSSKYCGNPAQIVILKDQSSTAVSTGTIYKYFIFNPRNWTIMDNFTGGDNRDIEEGSRWPLKEFKLGNYISHTDGPHTEALLRAGRYYGPACRIFDLYTNLLPPSGPSFDCKTASSLAEQTICKDPKLAALDHAYGASIQKSLRSASPEERQNIANKYDFDMFSRDISGTDKKEIAKVYEEALGRGKKTAGGFSKRKKVEAACGQARTLTEGAICGNPAFKKLDTEMADAYHRVFANTQPNTPARKALIEAQRQWLKTRDACGADAVCIEKAYRARIQALKAS